MKRTADIPIHVLIVNLGPETTSELQIYRYMHWLLTLDRKQQVNCRYTDTCIDC